MEFYLWGKPELEDMLHLPKNDRILFTFFGISLISKRRSRSTEIRFAVNNKNKLYRIFGEELGARHRVLLRDSKDDKYPYRESYKDFSERPRWKEYTASQYHALGLIFNVHKYFAYIDVTRKEFDFSEAVSDIYRNSDSEEDKEKWRELRAKVEDFWDHLPCRRQAMFCRDGLIRYNDMLVIDDKGDVAHKFPHIFVDFEGPKGPFYGFLEYAEVDASLYGTRHWLSDWTEIEIFPKAFPEPKIGKLHLNEAVDLDELTLRMFVHGNDSIRYFYDVDGKYEFLEQRDVIPVANSASQVAPKAYIQITYKRSISLKDYLKETEDGEYIKAEIERRVGRKVQPKEVITIFEFKRTYEWKFDPTKKI